MRAAAFAVQAETRQGTNAGSSVQECLHGRCVSHHRDRALENDWTGLVVLDVATGVFDHGHRLGAVHSRERKHEARLTRRTANATDLCRASAKS